MEICVLHSIGVHRMGLGEVQNGARAIDGISVPRVFTPLAYQFSEI